MSMAKHARQLTYEDYTRFPPDRRWELIEGESHVVPSPNARHQRIALDLATDINVYLRRHGGGEAFVAPFDTVLSEIDVFQPDIVFVADEDASVLTPDNIWGTPTWVVEVLSNPYYEQAKFRRYAAFTVYEYWLINPYEDTLDVSIREPSGNRRSVVHAPLAQVRPACLPGLEIDLSEILRR